MIETIQRKWQQWKKGPLMVWILIILTCGVFLGMTLTGLIQGQGLDGSYNSYILIQYGALFRPLVLLEHEYWRLVSPIFVHIGFTHLILNMFTLYFLGRQLELLLGHFRFLAIYLLTGVMGNLFSLAFANPNALSAGASTSLFGLFGIYVTLGQVYKQFPQIQAMSKQMLLLIVLNLLFALPTNLFGGSIDLYGHIGGVIGGLALGLVVSSPLLEKVYPVKSIRNPHIRIIGGMIFIFFIGVTIAYTFKKFGLS